MDQDLHKLPGSSFHLNYSTWFSTSNISNETGFCCLVSFLVIRMVTPLPCDIYEFFYRTIKAHSIFYYLFYRFILDFRYDVFSYVKIPRKCIPVFTVLPAKLLDKRDILRGTDLWIIFFGPVQCFGSVLFWYGFGSTDPFACLLFVCDNKCVIRFWYDFLTILVDFCTNFSWFRLPGSGRPNWYGSNRIRIRNNAFCSPWS